MSTSQDAAVEPPSRLAAYVRFTQKQYERLRKEELVTGKSIPTIIRDRCFKGDPVQPVFTAVATEEVLRQLTYFNRNLNQLTRYMHSGTNGTVLEDFQGLFRASHALVARIADVYGDRKNTL